MEHRKRDCHCPSCDEDTRTAQVAEKLMAEDWRLCSMTNRSAAYKEALRMAARALKSENAKAAPFDIRFDSPEAETAWHEVKKLAQTDLVAAGKLAHEKHIMWRVLEGESEQQPKTMVARIGWLG